jgi:hypothetical protein
MIQKSRFKIRFIDIFIKYKHMVKLLQNLLLPLMPYVSAMHVFFFPETGLVFRVNFTLNGYFYLMMNITFLLL